MKGWLSGPYLLDSLLAGAQRLLNLFAEIIAAENDSEPQIGYLRGCPGLDVPHTTLGGGPIRGMLAAGTPLNPLDGSGGRWFVVSGQYLYELDSSGSPINGLGGNPWRGSVGNDGRPVTLLVNGNQLGIVSAGQFYCDSGLGPVAINYPGSAYGDIAIGWAGTCNVVHGHLEALSGNPFNSGMNGMTILLNGVAYFVTNVVDPTHLNVGPLGYTVNLTGATYDIVLSNVIAFSAANPFTAADVGATLNFAGGGAFSAVSPTINSVDAYGNATLSSSPATEGSAGGSATEVFGPIYASSGAFLDSFFVVATPNSKVFQFSAPNDGSTFDPTDQAVKESYPDNIGAIAADHQELLILGESTMEVWQPGLSNDPNLPFGRNDSYTVPIGIAAPASLCSLRDGPVWIGASLRGQPIAYFAKGFVPVRISTHAIEKAWKKYAQFSDAIAFVYELDGHEFWQVSFPTGDQTWVYDRTASEQFGKPMWHERNSYDGSAFHRHRASCHCHVFNKHWVGDFANGQIYQLSDSIYTDNTQPMLCARTLPHLDANRLRQFFQKLQLDLETGGGNALTITVSWSDDGGTNWVGGEVSTDGGNTWSAGSADFVYTASTSKKLDRAAFWQLGSADNRVFRIAVTGNARKALVNCFLDYFVGIS